MATITPANLLVIFGVASILVAAPFVLVQRNFRRLLAYSSIDHAGIMVAALGFGGKLGALGAVLHMTFHAVAKPLLFFCAGNVQQKFGTPYFRKVTGVIHILPWTGGLFLLATFAVTGVPPFSLFQSEFTALSAGFAADHDWACGIVCLGIVIIFAGFLVHMSKLNLGQPAPGAVRGSECPWKLGAMMFVAVPVIVLGLALPRPLYDLMRRAAQLIGNTRWFPLPTHFAFRRIGQNCGLITLRQLLRFKYHGTLAGDGNLFSLCPSFITQSINVEFKTETPWQRFLGESGQMLSQEAVRIRRRD